MFDYQGNQISQSIDDQISQSIDDLTLYRAVG